MNKLYRLYRNFLLFLLVLVIIVLLYDLYIHHANNYDYEYIYFKTQINK